MGLQKDWKWCHKCQAITFAGGSAIGACVAGGQHDHSGSGNYLLNESDEAALGQAGWSWCQKCQSLSFSGSGAVGPCPAGGQHDLSGSGNYVLMENVTQAIGQSEWRWCQKCQGLSFSGSGAVGPCPAGGQHDLSGSGNYKLMGEGDAQSQQQGNLILHHLTCHHTTEQGHDEVYYLVGGRDGVGQQFSKRGPSGAEGADADDGTAWDMNDSGDKKYRQLDATVLHFALSPGQSVEASLALMESDGTNYGATVAAAAKIAATVANNPYVTVAAAIAGLLAQFIPKNQDDHLGSFFFRVRNDQGLLNLAEVGPGQYTAMNEPLNRQTGQFAVKVQHDDGDYDARFRLG
jgi:hypothetical protein